MQGCLAIPFLVLFSLGWHLLGWFGVVTALVIVVGPCAYVFWLFGTAGIASAVPDGMRVISNLPQNYRIGISYSDTGGSITDREITIKRILASGQGDIYLDSYCHLRKAPRQFRADRVRHFFDGDGVVLEPRSYLESNLGLPLLKRSIRLRKR